MLSNLFAVCQCVDCSCCPACPCGGCPFDWLSFGLGAAVTWVLGVSVVVVALLASKKN